MKVNLHVLLIKFEFRYAPSIFGEITGLGLSKFHWSNSFLDFFSKRLQILTWFLACKSISMFYRWSLSFVTLNQFLAKLRALDLVNFSDRTVFWTFFLKACRYWPDFWHVHVSQSPGLQIEFEFHYPPSIFGQSMGLGLSKSLRWNSLPDCFPKRLQILTWFLACKSITMIYRLSLSFLTRHWFLVKLRALDLVNFSDQTVFRTFFLNAIRYWPDFWHVNQPPWFTDRVRVSLPSIDFWRNYWPWNLVNFSDQTVFRTFFLNACRYWPDFGHAGQSQCFTDRVWVSLCSIDFWRNNRSWT